MCWRLTFLSYIPPDVPSISPQETHTEIGPINTWSHIAHWMLHRINSPRHGIRFKALQILHGRRLPRWPGCVGTRFARRAGEELS